MITSLASSTVTTATRLHAMVDTPSRSAIRFDEVLVAAERLSRWRMGTVVRYRPLPEESPEHVADRLLASLAPLAHLRGQGEQSVSSVQMLLDPATIDHDPVLLQSILAAAEAVHLPVTLDVVDPQRVDALMDQLAQWHKIHADLGLSLAAGAERSVADADRACVLGLRLRLVHVRHPGEVAAARKQAAEAFRQLIDRVAAEDRPIDLVCHEPQLVADSVERLRTANPHRMVTLELQPDQPHQGVLWVARTQAVPVRSFVGYGQPALRPANGAASRQPRVLWWSALSNSLGTLLPSVGSV